MTKQVFCNVLYIFLYTGLFFPIFSQAQQISVSPAIINFEGTPGQTVSRVINVTNNASDKTCRFTIDLLDWTRDSTGMKIFSRSGTLPYGMSDDIELPETEFLLEPLQTKIFTINYKIPPISSGPQLARNGMVVIHSYKEKTPAETLAAQSSIDIEIAYSFGVQMFYTAMGASYGDMELNAMALLPGSKDIVKISYSNTGDVHKMGNLRLELIDMSTGKETVLPALPFAIAPRAVQEKQIQLPYSLSKGTYLLVAVLDAGYIYQLKVAKKEIYVQ